MLFDGAPLPTEQGGRSEAIINIRQETSESSAVQGIFI